MVRIIKNGVLKLESIVDRSEHDPNHSSISRHPSYLISELEKRKTAMSLGP